LEARRAERKEKRRLQQRDKKTQKIRDRQALLEAGLPVEDERTVKCSVCGLTGHNKSSRICPNYDEDDDSMTDVLSPINHDLVKLEGTKLRFPKEAIKDQKVVVKIRKEKLPDYARKHLMDAGMKRPQRKKKLGVSRAQIELSNLLEEKIWKAVRAHAWAHPFMVPVTDKVAPDYHTVVKVPMDLGTIRNKVKEHEYSSRQSIMSDLKLMVDNCHMYNETRNPPPSSHGRRAPQSRRNCN